MRLSAVALAPLAILVFGLTLLSSRFSSASDNSSTHGLVDEHTPSRTSSPTCTDLTKVQGAVIEFGFEGNYPYSVKIDSNGQITASALRNPGLLPPFPAPIPLNIGSERNRISPSTLKGLVRLATGEAFWRLPKVIKNDSNSATLARFVKINLPCANKQVVVQNGTKNIPEVQQFAEVFMLLTDLVYDEPVGYKPLQ